MASKPAPAWALFFKTDSALFAALSTDLQHGQKTPLEEFPPVPLVAASRRSRAGSIQLKNLAKSGLDGFELIDGQILDKSSQAFF